MLLLAFLCFYAMGMSQCQNEIVSSQIKEIKHVQTQTAKLQARPHASKSELLELMRRGQL